MGLQEGITALIIVPLLDMLIAIKLHNHFAFQASEVGDVISDQNLPLEFVTGQLPPANKPPKQLLALNGGMAHGARQ